MYEAEMGAIVGAGLITGDMVDHAVNQAHIEQATAGQVEADFEALTAFYNSLSQLHTQLRARLASLKGQALDLHDRPAAGHVPGVQKAWRAIAESAGVAEHNDSLYGNLQTIDQWVQYYMGAVLDNVHEYAQTETVNVQQFGKASDADVPVPTRAPVSTTPRTTSSSGGW